MALRMFSGQAGLNFSFNLSDDLELLLDPPAEEEEEEEGRLSSTGFVVLSVVLGFIMTFGFLNNLVVLLLFCKFKKLRTPVNMLLLNISVSDMLVCVFGTTLSFASSIRGRWLLGRSGCNWYGFINSCFGIVSLISLVILSYDRYSTLTVYNKRGPNYRKPLLAVGGSWLYSLFWTVPPLLGWSSYGEEGAGTSCSVSWTARTAQSHAYIICLFIFCLGLPVLVMIYCYSRLLWAVKQGRGGMAEPIPADLGRQAGYTLDWWPASGSIRNVGKIRKTAARRREYHILFMVLTTAACYLLCWMPYGVVAMMATFGPPDIISPVASVVPSLLAKSSTVINPLIYILMNKQFYRCFLILFHCDHWSAQNGNTSMPSKTTVLQLHRRVSSNTVTCAAQVSAIKPRCTPADKLTTAPEVAT
ncbi:parapinopsin-like isoform X1 [Dunckerocampus dactyliophorus]|uniref:parapinopsin-like isoform X1 n=1 Tax=Dunckerocampus dactyliophorus TaxID=161453 RepID=UPI0024068094|nr:parapinopsin-like isoform X1 [Dunckerocampus dactyliophorus]XP_054642892.1 parapinopsin-like isoform X1 [Dunckerocampus dactyliophorus]